MAKPVKSQWDFGELFPPGQVQSRKVLSVAELTSQVRRLLEKEFAQVWVSGEITNFRLQNSGHIYFTLKDAGAQVSCVLFRGEPQVDRSVLQDGRKVILRGEVTVYEPRGQYQLRVTAVEMEGVGALQVAFEKLKQKLKAEGLFDQDRKRSIPRYPQRIGLVTSPTGAAIRDVVHVMRRRNPAVELILAPCRVQGYGAAQEIAQAIRLLNHFFLQGRRRQKPGTGAALDAILVTRGGGSLEDLWAFNEEIVARAVFDSAVPIVSAVGHEIDFTICDFVADLRAATPSAAAELLTEGVFSSCLFVAEAGARISQLCAQRLEEKAYRAGQLISRFGRVHPRRVVDDWLQHVDQLDAGLQRCLKRKIRDTRAGFTALSLRLGRIRPATAVRQRREVLQLAQQRLTEQARHACKESRSKVQSLEERLRLLGPEQVLARGYSITTDAETGEVIRSAGQAPPGSLLKSRVKTGEILSRVEQEAPTKPPGKRGPKNPR